MSSEKMLTRVGALLRQAESTDNPHEGEAFMAAAQRLATSSAIDLAVARAHTASSEKRATPTQRLITIGEPGKRGLRTYAQLFISIAAANDVQCDIAQTGAVIFAYGFAGDIDVCEALYSSLLFQMVRDSDAYIRSGAYRGETTIRTVVETRGRRRVSSQVRKPVAGVTARLNFQMAYASRIGARLTETKQETETKVVAESSSETALVLRNKEIELKNYYSSNSKARGTWKGGGRADAGHSSHARKAGDRAAQSARLGNLPEIGGARGQLSS
ncbi:DUF2786 domain-containing protein [Rhodococcus sp. ARC_M6]|uniref:DUF2786 domain-containing protein n=1 Tax=Rhodococcus sp. ARC_M6 TaxID=2928852 RepID=UPI001FB29D0D|nr:DUF2786 domain-containing protein [Rhodococcus sp. ARC_M6]MCJ0906591.1 DUF2786 domain-containing protein [Rhodococcus sp. ARC_M6]